MVARFLRMAGFNAIITVAVMLPMAIGAVDESGCHKPFIDNAYETHRTGKPLLFPRTQYRVGVTVFLSCKPGYTMQGSREIQCGSDSEWNRPLPYCVPVTCSQPNVPNAFIAPQRGKDMTWETVYTFADTVQLQCDIGYLMRGRREIHCGSDGKWSDLPACQPVFCPEPEVKNGSITHKHGSEIMLGGGYRYSDVVTVRCDTGYIVRGGSEIRCEADGKWSDLPTCERADCGPPTSLQFAELRKIHANKDSFPVGSTVTYSCLPGYVRISGKISATTCKEDSQWSEISEFCRPRRCGSPGEVQSGWFEVTGHIVGSIATLICYKGYRIAGSSTFKRCLETGMWSNDVPNCEPVLCERPPDIPNAVHSGIHIDNFAYLVSVSYDCKIGALHGAQSIYCTEHGNWSAPAPECIDVSCPVPIVRNGILQHGFASQVPYGEIMEFQCSTGYMPEHNSTIRCGRDGMWHPAYPVCVPISCRRPLIKHGNVILNKDGEMASETFTGTVTVQCQAGYVIRGESDIRCDVYGRLLAVPTCEPVLCPTPDVRHGQIFKSNGDLSLGPGYKLKDSVTVKCDAGYVVCGGREIQCGADGKWSPTVPTCVPVSVIEHHSMPIPGLRVQTLLNAGVADEGRRFCHDKFLPLGRQEFTCSEKDTMDPAITRVVPVSASTLCESVERNMKDHWQKMNVEDKYLHLEMGKLCLDIISLHLQVEKLNATLTPQVEKLNATLTPSKPKWWQHIPSIGFS